MTRTPLSTQRDYPGNHYSYTYLPRDKYGWWLCPNCRINVCHPYSEILMKFRNYSPMGNVACSNADLPRGSGVFPHKVHLKRYLFFPNPPYVDICMNKGKGSGRKPCGFNRVEYDRKFGKRRLMEREEKEFDCRDFDSEKPIAFCTCAYNFPLCARYFRFPNTLWHRVYGRPIYYFCTNLEEYQKAENERKEDRHKENKRMEKRDKETQAKKSGCRKNNKEYKDEKEKHKVEERKKEKDDVLRKWNLTCNARILETTNQTKKCETVVTKVTRCNGRYGDIFGYRYPDASFVMLGGAPPWIPPTEMYSDSEYSQSENGTPRSVPLSKDIINFRHYWTSEQCNYYRTGKWVKPLLS